MRGEDIEEGNGGGRRRERMGLKRFIEVLRKRRGELFG